MRIGSLEENRAHSSHTFSAIKLNFQMLKKLYVDAVGRSHRRADDDFGVVH
jgi:hypothetical protein